MSSLRLVKRIVVAAEAKVRHSRLGPWIAAVAYRIWHQIWDSFFEIRSGFVGYAARVNIVGHPFLFDMRDRSVARILYLFREYESNELMLLARQLREGMSFMDIGANSGVYTLIAAELVGMTGKVFAFEPCPTNMSILETNLALNGLTNVIAQQRAITDRVGQVELYLSNINPGDHRIQNGRDDDIYNAGRRRTKIIVDATSVDEYLRSTGLRIDVVKMDIQGAEAIALHGMRETLADNEDILLITEFWPYGLERFGSSPSQFIRDIEGSGFTLYEATGDGTPSVIRASELESKGADDRHLTLFCSKHRLN